jgi:hypothetical protein
LGSVFEKVKASRLLVDFRALPPFVHEFQEKHAGVKMVFRADESLAPLMPGRIALMADSDRRRLEHTCAWHWRRGDGGADPLGQGNILPENELRA